MSRDCIFLLKAPFAASSGRLQFCPDSMLIEGLLARFPDKLAGIAVTRIDFPKPRKELVELVGEEHQSCPNLVRETNGAFTSISEPREILRVLHEDYGIPAAQGLVD